MSSPTATLTAAIEARRGSTFSSRQLAFVTGIDVKVVSALLRRFADRGQLERVGITSQQARGGLRATVWKVKD